MKPTIRGRLLASQLNATMEAVVHAAALMRRRKPLRWPIERVRNINFAGSDHPEQHVDIYYPTDREGPLPVVLYIHGGGFGTGSTNTHWLVACEYARLGHIVVNVSYRRTPHVRYPDPLRDVMAAAIWTRDNVERFGGDPARLVFAGESAGGNLSLALTCASCYELPEMWARSYFSEGIVPIAAMPACGILQVSDVERYWAHRRSTWPERSLIRATARGYVPDERTLCRHSLADPLLIIESELSPERPLPPMFALGSTGDPLVDDTRRLADALRRRGVYVEAPVFDGPGHGFHLMTWERDYKAAWAQKGEFLARVESGSVTHEPAN